MAVDLVYWKNKILKSVFGPNKGNKRNVEKISSSYIKRMMERNGVWVRHEMYTNFS